TVDTPSGGSRRRPPPLLTNAAVLSAAAAAIRLLLSTLESASEGFVLQDVVMSSPPQLPGRIIAAGQPPIPELKITLSSGGGSSGASSGGMLLRIFVDDTEQLLARVALAPAVDADAAATVELAAADPNNGTRSADQQDRAHLSALLHALQLPSVPLLPLPPSLVVPQPL
ncbi:hypothetical protein Vretimale_7422, partial [Volvox reticuliferus]